MYWWRERFRKAWRQSTPHTAHEMAMCNRSSVIRRIVILSSPRSRGTKLEGIGSAIPMHFVVIGTDGIIGIGGGSIVTTSFSSPADIISWTQAIGTQLTVMIRLVTITTTTGRSTPIVISYPTR